MEKKQEDERIRTENILRGNPLLNKNEPSEFKVKRRYVFVVIFLALNELSVIGSSVIS